MGNFWCVDPANNVELLDLSYGGRDFKVWVKRELSVGEQRSIDTAGFRSLKGFQKSAGGAETEPEIGIDWNRQSFARTATYLTDWSLTDDAGNKMLVSRDAIESLRPAIYKVIEDAITAHVERMAEIRKNEQTGAPSPQAISA